MATATLGTNATTSLTALKFTGNMTIADVASINAAIKNDGNPALNQNPAIAPTSFTTQGQLTLPGGRGTINLLPGDYVAVDPSTGWPIVVSTNCAANGAITHT